MARTSTHRSHHPRHLPGKEPPRTFHMLDPENLAGGSRLYGVARRLYEAKVPFGPSDHVLVGCDVTQAFAVHDAFPGQLTVGKGPDGADRALVTTIDQACLEARFDRLVIGSGDHAFAEIALVARACGLEVGALSLRRSISSELYRAVDWWYPIDGDDGPEGMQVEIDARSEQLRFGLAA